MATTSCISHPAKTHFFMVMFDYLKICNDNECAASLLSLYEHVHNAKLVEIEQKLVQKPYYTVTDDDFKQDANMGKLRYCLGRTKSENTIKKANNLLIDFGYIKMCQSKEGGIHLANQIIFCVDVIQKAIDRGVAPSLPATSTEPDTTPPSNLTHPSIKFDPPPGSNLTHLSISKELSNNKENISSQFSDKIDRAQESEISLKTVETRWSSSKPVKWEDSPLAFSTDEERVEISRGLRTLFSHYADGRYAQVNFPAYLKKMQEWYTNNAKGRATKNVKWWITLRDWVVRDEAKGCALYVKSSTPMPLAAKGQDEASVPVLLSE